MSDSISKTIDEYIAGFPEDTQNIRQQIRNTIKNVAPDAVETISYAIPSFKINGVILVYFAAFKRHIGFYPTPKGIEAFKEELSAFKMGKGSVQFPLDKPIPLELIGRIVLHNRLILPQITTLNKIKDKKII